MAAAPGLVADLRFDDLVAAGWKVTGPTATPDGGANASLTKAFATPQQANAVLAEVSGAGGPLVALRVAQDRSFASVETTVDGTAVGPTLAAFSDPALVEALGGVPLADRVTPEQLASGFGLTVRFTLPGSITAPTGTVNGATVVWQPSMAPGVVTSLSATAQLRDDEALAARDRERWADRAFWAWLGLAALVGVVALAVVVVRRRHRARST